MVKRVEDRVVTRQAESVSARVTRAAIQTAGLGCIAGGAWMLSPAAGLIVLGAVIVGLSVLRWAMAR